MVAAIDNRARVWFRPVTSLSPGPSAGWLTGSVLIESVSDLPGFANLLAEATGREFTVIAPVEIVGQLAEIAVWNVDVELVGPHRIAVRGVAGG